MMVCVMETTLHRQLKDQYAGEAAETEVTLGRFRIDAVAEDRLIEIQFGPLAAIRDKVKELLKRHRVLIVKPVIHRRRLVKLSRKNGREVDRRMSPKRGRMIELFHDLTYFTRVFPNENLTIEAPLVDVEQWRYPARRRRKGFAVLDVRLEAIRETHSFRRAQDLLNLLPELPAAFDTRHLAELLHVERWIAQRIAYCLRETGAARATEKRRTGFVYQLADAA